jgi:hypothetical protein
MIPWIAMCGISTALRIWEGWIIGGAGITYREEIVFLPCETWLLEMLG